MENATEVSHISPGSPGYLGALQREITIQWNNEPLQGREKYQALADEWSSGQAPDTVKRRQVILS